MHTKHKWPTNYCFCAKAVLSLARGAAFAVIRPTFYPKSRATRESFTQTLGADKEFTAVIPGITNFSDASIFFKSFSLEKSFALSPIAIILLSSIGSCFACLLPSKEVRFYSKGLYSLLSTSLEIINLWILLNIPTKVYYSRKKMEIQEEISNIMNIEISMKPCKWNVNHNIHIMQEQMCFLYMKSRKT